MRFLKILGMVVALHVVLFAIFLLNPGCQSTPTSPATTPAATETAPAGTLAPAPIDETANWHSQPVASSSVSNTISSAPLPGSMPAGTLAADTWRAAPSRPDRPETYVSTGDTVPTVLNPPPTTHVIRSGDTLGKIAARYGTTTTALQKANPGIKPASLRVGQVIKLPATVSAPAATVSPVAAPAGAKYTVRSGDSLSVIAARNGTTVTALRQANNLRGDNIQVGQELIIPGGVAQAAASPAPTYTPAPASGISRISGDASTATFRHVIKSGETLGVIAKRYDVTVQEIMSANNVSDPRKIRAGQELVIPGYRGTGAVAAPSPAPAATPPAATTPPPAETQPAAEPAPAEPLPEAQPLIPAELDAPPAVPVDSEPVPTP